MNRADRLRRKRNRLAVQIAALDFAIARIGGDAVQIAKAAARVRETYAAGPWSNRLLSGVYNAGRVEMIGYAVPVSRISRGNGSALKRALSKVRKQEQELIRTCRTYRTNWPDNSRAAWRMLLRDLRSGKSFSFCGLGDSKHGTWRDLYAAEYPLHSIPERCPTVWVPRFLSYQSFLRMVRGAEPVKIVGPIKLQMGNGSTITAAAPSADTVRGMPA